MNNRKEEDVIDLSYYIKFIRKNWIWFPVCIILSVLVAYFYVKVSPEVFEVSTSVIVNEDDNGANNLSAQLMSDIGFISSKKSFANEMLVLQSSTLIDKALQSLDFQVSYYKKEKFYDEELYKTTPFVVIFDKNHPQPVDCEFVVEVLDNNNFRLTCNQNDVTVFNFNTNHILKKVPTFKIALNGKFNQFVRADDLNVKLILNKGYNLEELQSVLFAFSIHTQNELIRSFQEKLIVETPDMESTVAKLSMKTSTPQKTIDFLNNLTSSYVNNELEKNQFMSMKTIDYINNQLNAIQSSLRIAEENLQRFRSSNELIDVNMQSGRLFEELSKMEAEKAILEINMKYYEYIDEYFQKEGSVELIAPSAMGIDDELLNSLVEELIRLNAERNSLIENNQEKSPYLRQINIRIENLKNMVAENIAYYKQSNKIALNDLNGRINQLNNEVRKMPKTQRELFGYERQFKVNDAIYSYLLQKKAEAEIAKASYQSDTEILEPANVDAQVAPKKEIILTGSF
ncbi:MAG: GumC family protein, partial [Cyclobacteriaceae bacterium]